MREPVFSFVAIGANLGDPVHAVRDAIARISALPGTRLVRSSSLYRTAPHDAEGPDFINAVVQIETQLEPLDLLGQLQQLEADAGRERPFRNAPRTLDLDVLMYGFERIETARLIVPHPRMRERAFVLVPLAEIAPALVTDGELAPVGGQHIERLALPPT